MQDRTERDGYDTRQQLSVVSGAFDPREATVNRFNAWTGEPEIEQYTVFANAGYDLGSGAETLWLGQLPEPRLDVGRLLPPRPRRAQHDRRSIRMASCR